MITNYKEHRKEVRNDLDELEKRRMIDQEWKDHMVTCREHSCSTCFAAGFKAGVKFGKHVC